MSNNEYINISIKDLPQSLQHVNAEDIIRILTAFEPLIQKPKKIKTSPVISSFEIGRRGEFDIKTAIQGFDKVKPKSHSGDLIISKPEYPSILIMVEVKNYSSTIPRALYEKFESEVDLGLYSGGVFITNRPVQNVEKKYNNKIIIDSFDETAVNLGCHMLWNKLYERAAMKLICDNMKITKNCLTLLNSVEVIKHVQHDIEQFIKTSGLLLNRAATSLSRTNIDIKKVTNKLSSDVGTLATSFTLEKKIIIPSIDCTILTLGRHILEEFLLTYATGHAISTQKANIMEYNFDGNKINLKFLKKKIDVMFKPRQLIIDFDTYNVNYIDGLCIVEITEKNYHNDSVYKTIRDLF